MKHIRRKITVAVLGTMLFVFAALLATVNIFIPEYLTSEAQKAVLLEDERKKRLDCRGKPYLLLPLSDRTRKLDRNTVRACYPRADAACGRENGVSGY